MKTPLHQHLWSNTTILRRWIMIYITGYLLQRIGLVTILVQQAVSRVGGDQRASGVCMVNWADVGSGGVWGSFTEKENIAYQNKYSKYKL